MVLNGLRRRAAVVAATAVVTVVLVAAVTGRGCGGDSPEEAVRAFEAAAQAGDRDAVFALLGPRTRAKLAQRAERVSSLGERRYQASEMIGIGSVTAGDAPRRIEVVSEDDDAAVVELIDAADQRSRLQLVREHGHWRIEP